MSRHHNHLTLPGAIAAAVTLVIATIAAIVYYCCKRKRRAQLTMAPSAEQVTPQNQYFQPLGTAPYPNGTTSYPPGTTPYPPGTSPHPSGTTPYPSGTSAYPPGTTPCPVGQYQYTTQSYPYSPVGGQAPPPPYPPGVTQNSTDYSQGNNYPIEAYQYSQSNRQNPPSSTSPYPLHGSSNNGPNQISSYRTNTCAQTFATFSNDVQKKESIPPRDTEGKTKRNLVYPYSNYPTSTPYTSPYSPSVYTNLNPHQPNSRPMESNSGSTESRTYPNPSDALFPCSTTSPKYLVKEEPKSSSADEVTSTPESNVNTNKA